jgi:hypothetical protein
MVQLFEFAKVEEEEQRGESLLLAEDETPSEERE